MKVEARGAEAETTAGAPLQNGLYLVNNRSVLLVTNRTVESNREHQVIVHRHPKVGALNEVAARRAVHHRHSIGIGPFAYLSFIDVGRLGVHLLGH